MRSWGGVECVRGGKGHVTTVLIKYEKRKLYILGYFDVIMQQRHKCVSGVGF